MLDKQTITDLTNSITDNVLKILRNQREAKQEQDLYSIYILNTQIFSKGSHYVTDKIAFNSPFKVKPTITFGFIIDQDIPSVTTAGGFAPTGYTPPIIFPYVYAFTHDAGRVDGFYMGLYALTPPPTLPQNYTVAWRAKGKASIYSGQRIDEAWAGSYNRNEASHLMNDTGQVDDQ